MHSTVVHSASDHPAWVNSAVPEGDTEEYPIKKKASPLGKLLGDGVSGRVFSQGLNAGVCRVARWLGPLVFTADGFIDCHSLDCRKQQLLQPGWCTSGETVRWDFLSYTFLFCFLVHCRRKAPVHKVSMNSW